MSEIKIIRNDRGLDFRRIEQFLKMFQEKCQSKSRLLSSKESETKANRKKEAFTHFNLDSGIEELKSIDEKIDALKAKKTVIEDTIRCYTQGKDKEKRYNRYDEIREDSPIQEYINAGIADISKKRDEVWALNQQLSNELWYAKDLEQAIEIMQSFQNKLETIGLEDGKNES